MVHDILYITKLPGTFYNIKHIYFYRKDKKDNAEGAKMLMSQLGTQNIDILCTDLRFVCVFAIISI